MTCLRAIARSRFSAAAITIGMLGLSAGAGAAVSYSGYGEIGLTLVSVTSASMGGGGGNDNVTEGWSILSAGNVIDSDASSSGSGSADVAIEVDGGTDWVIGETSLQYAESFGDAGVSSAGAGSAQSFADTDFSILVQNDLETSLVFEFAYSSFVSADVLFDVMDEDGGAYAAVFMADDFSDSLLSSSADVFIGGPLSAAESISQSLTFTLQGGLSNTISGVVYSDGWADTPSPVPVPPAVWLYASALIGLLGVSRRSAKKTV